MILIIGESTGSLEETTTDISHTINKVSGGGGGTMVMR